MPSGLTDGRIDEAVLAVVDRSRPQKVARVISLAGDRLVDQGHLPEADTHSETALDLIALRIQALAAQGTLERYGDLRSWRHSEVKLGHGEDPA